MAVHQSKKQIRQEANAKLPSAVYAISVFLPCPLREPHPSEGSAGPGSTEFLLQTLDKVVIEEKKLTMGQKAGKDAFNAVSP